MAIPRRFLPPTTMLAAFEAAARTGNFSLAAEELNFCQSAISRQVRALEERLGTELFVRDRQRVTLTNAGISYARDIREALRHIGAASQAIKSNPHTITLNLAILPSFGARWLIPRLGSFFSAHPEVSINFSTCTTPFDLDAESFDGALHFGAPASANAESIPLMGETLVPVAGQRFAQTNRFSSPKDLLNAPLLILKSRSDAWERWFIANSVDYRPLTGLLFDQFDAMASAARASLGVALLPRFLYTEEIVRGELIPLIKNDTPSEHAYHFAWPQSRRDNPALKHFREWIKEQAATETSELKIIKTEPFPEEARRRSRQLVES